MYNKVVSFLSIHNVLYEYQFGFRKGYSTEMALATASEWLSTELDKGNSSIAIFLDLRKAFDTVDHSILLNKLQHYGIRGIAYDWFKSYLDNRTQCIKCNGVVSEEMNIKSGIAQGSQIGPLCFLIYLNDLSNLLDEAFIIMYADDTSVFFKDANIDNLVDTVNNRMSIMVDWLNANKLSLNVDKTKAMLFTRKININRNIDIVIDNHRIEFVTSTTFLGVIIDADLSWSHHIQMVCKKVAKISGLIYKASTVLNRESLLNLYNTLFYPHLTYCNTIWGNGNVTELNRILLLQKRVVRNIYGLAYREHTSQYFAILGILNVYQLHKYLSLLFVHRWFYHKIPTVFNHFYSMNARPVHSKRQSYMYALKGPKCRTVHYQRQLRANSASIWNEFVIEYCPCYSKSQFALDVRTWLLVHENL